MIETERDLFERELRELYDIERELDRLQPELGEAAIDDELASFFSSHHEGTSSQIDRLESVFDAIGADPGRRESAPLEGLATQHETLMDEIRTDALRDDVVRERGALIERLEISKLETLLSLAERLDLGADVAEKLETTKREAEDGLEELQALSTG